MALGGEAVLGCYKTGSRTSGRNLARLLVDIEGVDRCRRGGWAGLSYCRGEGGELVMTHEALLTSGEDSLTYVGLRRRDY